MLSYGGEKTFDCWRPLPLSKVTGFTDLAPLTGKRIAVRYSECKCDPFVSYRAIACCQLDSSSLQTIEKKRKCTDRRLIRCFQGAIEREWGCFFILFI